MLVSYPPVRRSDAFPDVERVAEVEAGALVAFDGLAPGGILGEVREPGIGGVGVVDAGDVGPVAVRQEGAVDGVAADHEDAVRVFICHQGQGLLNGVGDLGARDRKVIAAAQDDVAAAFEGSAVGEGLQRLSAVNEDRAGSHASEIFHVLRDRDEELVVLADGPVAVNSCDTVHIVHLTDCT